MTPSYEVKKENGKDLCLFTFEWTDKYGVYHKLVTEDITTAETTIGLLSGNICLADLEP